jgi:asparagine synthase (glutamine-hydrolysing)
MCGIAGWVDWEEDLTHHRSTLERMADTLGRRGPDAQGCWISPRSALAHRRLIVIDPAGGKQPMIYQENGYTYALTYNGEIYNFRELRRELERQGHAFRTQSDTEVLLHAYIEWGEDCVHHLNGIFAFGLWDEQKQQLLLARDHLGVKPLFYAQRGSAILFGSELKALLAHPAVKTEIDATGLAEIFGFRRAPGSGIFRDVHELRPGHIATFTRERTRVTRYWMLRSVPHTDDVETTAEKIRALLEDTVHRQLIADMPVVAMLSGGLDSSALASLTAREFKREGKILDTYSVDFVDSAQNFHGNALRPSLDAPYVKQVAEYIGSNQHTIVVNTPELRENMLVPMRSYDLPASGEMDTSLYLLCKAMKEHATVAISGESADEVFGGYPWFRDEAAVNASTFPWLSMMESLGGRMAVPWLSPEMEQRANPYVYMNRLYREGLAEVPRLEEEDPKNARMREVFYLSLIHFLPMLLDRKDRMSMATGFEVRVPFCDYRLVEYVWNIPWEMKTVGDIEKGILRKAMTGALPEDVRMRRKSAYPSAQNPAYERETYQWAMHILDDANSPIQPFINANAIRSIAEREEPLPPLRLLALRQWHDLLHC